MTMTMIYQVMVLKLFRPWSPVKKRKKREEKKKRKKKEESIHLMFDILHLDSIMDTVIQLVELFV